MNTDNIACVSNALSRSILLSLLLTEKEAYRFFVWRTIPLACCRFGGPWPSSVFSFG